MSKVEKQQVPKIRFEGFSDKWSDKVIGDIADIKRGASPRPISDPKWFNDNSAIGWVRISDVTRSFRVLEKTEQYLSDEGVKKSRLIKSGSIIMSICATIGKPVYTAFDVCIHDGFVVFDDLKIDADYTLYFLQTIQDKWYQYGQPGTQVNLNSDIVSNENIKYPSLEEQTQIGNFFQQLDQLIELQTRAVESAESYKKAMLQKMFPQKGEKVPRVRFAGFSGDWEEKTLDKVAMIVGGGTPDTKVAEYWNGDINWFAPAEIGKYIYAENSTRKITKLGLQKSSAKILPALKTILFTSRAGIGDMAILKVDACTNQGFQSLIVKDGFDVYFIYSMGSFIKQQALRIASGSTFLEISGKALGRILQRYPVVEEQTAIGNFFQKLDQQIEQQAQKLATYQHLKKAMLQRMFV